jgi:hypothetical protein
VTIRDDALAVIATDPAVKQAFAATSKGDRSILRHSLEHEGCVAMTNAGSPNDALWACFIRHGWMEDVALPDDLKAAMPGGVQRKLTELGRRAIPVILPILYAETSQK